MKYAILMALMMNTVVIAEEVMMKGGLGSDNKIVPVLGSGALELKQTYNGRNILIHGKIVSETDTVYKIHQFTHGDKLLCKEIKKEDVKSVLTPEQVTKIRNDNRSPAEKRLVEIEEQHQNEIKAALEREKELLLKIRELQNSQK